MLPKMHGFEVCRKSRSDPRTRQVPIIIMTAIYRGWRFAQDARETYGAEDYMEKPFRIDDLLRRVEAVLESTAGRGKAGGPSAEPQFKKGKELLLAGQVDAAVAAFEEATRVDPFSAEAHYHLAKALRAKGDAFRAMTAFEKAAELDPSSFIAVQEIRRTRALIDSQQNPPAPAPPPPTSGLGQRIQDAEGPVELAPISVQPITLKLAGDSRMIYESLGKIAGINVLFDPDYTSRRVSIELNAVTLDQALNIVSLESKTFWRPVTSNTICGGSRP